MDGVILYEAHKVLQKDLNSLYYYSTDIILSGSVSFVFAYSQFGHMHMFIVTHACLITVNGDAVHAHRRRKREGCKCENLKD